MNDNPFTRPNEMVKRVQAQFGITVTSEEVMRTLAIFAVAREMHKADIERDSMKNTSRPGSVVLS